MTETSTSASDASAGTEPVWELLPFHNAQSNFLAPDARAKGFALAFLAPVVIASVYGMVPVKVQGRMGEVTTLVTVLAAIGAFLFLGVLFEYRLRRRRKQFRLNSLLAIEVPADFVLYLRSFRRAGIIAVPNHLPELVDRRLYGNFWDIELALCTSLADKLPLIAVGPTPKSVGAAKLTTDDESWQDLVKRLAETAHAIVIVPDDRKGTLWEIRYVLSDVALSRKTVLVMPPEQYGWIQRIARLPSVQQSWENARCALEPYFALPRYDPAGAFCRFDSEARSVQRTALAGCEPAHVRNLFAHVIAGVPMQDDQATAKPKRGEGWRDYVDPIWVMVFSCFVALGVIMDVAGISGGFAFNSIVGAAAFASLFAFVVDTSAYPFASRAGRMREWLGLATWVGYRNAPGVVRASVVSLITYGTVFIVRGYIAEPWKIPSSSMRPTAVVGDYVFVRRSAYDFKLPFAEITAVSLHAPERGDLVVFRYPVDPSKDFFKRIVGVGGDVVTYEDKKLTVNGQALPQTRDGTHAYVEGLRQETLDRYVETARNGDNGHSYAIGIRPDAAPVYPQNVRLFPQRDECLYNERGFTCKVPHGHFFVMGDNRDNSDDSRYWGFVPAENIHGKVTRIAFNWNDVVTGRFERTGRVPP